MLPNPARAASECACLVRSTRFWLVSFGTESARAFHEMGHQFRDDGSPCCRIDIFDHGGKTCQADKGEAVGRLRAAERPLRFRLRSIELVHDVHLRERPIDAGYRSGAATSRAASASHRTAK